MPTQKLIEQLIVIYMPREKNQYNLRLVQHIMLQFVLLNSALISLSGNI